MARNDKLRSREVYRIGQSPAPYRSINWETMQESKKDRTIYLAGMPSWSSIITALVFVILIIVALVTH